MMNSKLLTSAAVLAVAAVFAVVFLSLNDQGIEAEVVDAQAIADTAGGVGGILICTAPNAGLAADRAFVHILGSTELIDQRRRSPAKVRPDAFEPGQRVRVWTSDETLESDPVQVFATRISIMADPVPGRPSRCAL